MSGTIDLACCCCIPTISTPVEGRLKEEDEVVVGGRLCVEKRLSSPKSSCSLSTFSPLRPRQSRMAKNNRIYTSTTAHETKPKKERTGRRIGESLLKSLISLLDFLISVGARYLFTRREFLPLQKLYKEPSRNLKELLLNLLPFLYSNLSSEIKSPLRPPILPLVFGFAQL